MAKIAAFMIIFIGILCAVYMLIINVNAPLSHEHMVYVEGGTFTMTDGEIEASGDAFTTFIGNEIASYKYEAVLLEHEVTLHSYYISKYEVTQKEWKEIMGNNPSWIKGNNLPVMDVSWNSCIEFCNALSLKNGLEECYEIKGEEVYLNIDANGYRLPTEAEWVFAARGGNESLGYQYSGSNNIDEVAWYNNRGIYLIVAPVGKKTPNEIGIYDMSGNVWEWCWDRLGSFSYAKQTNPTGSDLKTYRINRGGSYASDAKFCRIVNRGDYTFACSFDHYGLRLVKRP